MKANFNLDKSELNWISFVGFSFSIGKLVRGKILKASTIYSLRYFQ